MALEILDSRVYIGPSTWGLVPMIQMTVDIGELEERPSDKIEGFNDRLIDLMPTLYEHYCSVGEPGGFIQRLRDGTWMGHVMEHVAIELQNLAGLEVNRGLTRSTSTHALYNVVFQYEHQDVGLEAGRLAARFLNWLIYDNDPEFDYETQLEQLIRLAEQRAFGPSTRALVDEAKRRNIPVIRLDDKWSLVQMGHGVHQRRIWATVTSNTSDIAVDLASHKRLTNKLLQSVGIPVPRAESVGDADDAVAMARRIGYPVVLKPLDGNHGRGVQINLKSDDEVREHFDDAMAESRQGRVVVESFIVGRDHRILVINGQMVACAERVPAHVIGDGTHTVQELVDTANLDPRRGIGHEKVLTRIQIDQAVEDLLATQEMTLDSIPERGKFVQLRLTGNMSTGGTAIDRTDDIHPDNVAIAEQAAQVIGLDIAGIDMIVDDISKPLKDQGGAICEINAGPGFRMHTHPTIGHPRDVARPVIEGLFPRGIKARVPIIAITGTNGKTTTSRMIAHIFKMDGRRVGLTTTDGIYIDGVQILKGDMSGPRSASMVLQNPTVDLAVLETARGGIIREGLGFDRCDVAVVTNIAADHLGKSGVNTLKDLAQVKAVVPRAVFRDGHSVLNADDPRCLALKRVARGELILFSTDEHNPHVREHVRSRGIAVVLKETINGEHIYILEGKRETEVLNVSHIPATFEGRARANVKNALAAVAATYAMNMSVETIRTGLRSFSTSFYQTPGRLNVMDAGGFRVIVDYCHNPAGMEELTDFVQRLRPANSTLVIGIPGDRRNEDIAMFAQIAATEFDNYIIREDRNLRGRRAGEVAGLLRQALLDHGIGDDKIQIITNEIQATRAALETAKGEDLIVVLADKTEEVWNTVTQFTSQLDSKLGQPTAAGSPSWAPPAD